MVKQDVIPAIIPESYDYLEQRAHALRGVVRALQVDVMNGSYAPTHSWPYVGVQQDMFEALRRDDQGLPFWQDFEYEIDLLVAEPEKHISEWGLAGASRIILHLESTNDLAPAIERCARERLEVAVALTPSTDIAQLEPYIDQVVFVQCMGNDRVGHHGVALDPRVHDKVGALHKWWPDLLVGIDIGVSVDTIPALYKSGVRRFAAGSAVFAGGDPVRGVRTLIDTVHACISS
jgi:ribulose-phosphate 3-epimerase